MQKLSPKALAAIAVVVVLLIIGLVAFLRRPPAPTGQPTAPSSAVPTATPSGTPSVAPVSEAPSAGTPPKTLTEDLQRTLGTNEITAPAIPVQPVPKLEYTYTLETALPETPSVEAPITTYKDITWTWAKQLATSYGFPEMDPSILGSSFIFEDVSGSGDRETVMILTVNSFSGFSDFRATYPASRTSPKVRTNGQAEAVAREFLQKTGQLAPDVNPAKFYRLAADPTTIFVEYQRAWKPFPILESLGMLRTELPAGGNLTPGTEGRFPDDTVVQTNDGTDGYARMDDFNTATVAVDLYGRVVSAVVNTRPIDQILTGRTLKSAQVAWEELTAGQGILGFTLLNDPSETNATWEQTFPNGVASSQDATVKSAILAYLEKPSGIRQSYLQPVYIFRGQARLATGPLADFIVAIPALVDDSLPQ